MCEVSTREMVKTAKEKDKRMSKKKGREESEDFYFLPMDLVCAML